MQGGLSEKKIYPRITRSDANEEINAKDFVLYGMAAKWERIIHELHELTRMKRK